MLFEERNRVDLRSLVEHAIEDNRGFADSYGVRIPLLIVLTPNCAFIPLDCEKKIYKA
jgi:hypothetical protein